MPRDLDQLEAEAAAADPMVALALEFAYALEIVDGELDTSGCETALLLRAQDARDAALLRMTTIAKAETATGALAAIMAANYFLEQVSDADLHRSVLRVRRLLVAAARWLNAQSAASGLPPEALGSDLLMAELQAVAEPDLDEVLAA